VLPSPQLPRFFTTRSQRFIVASSCNELPLRLLCRRQCRTRPPPSSQPLPQTLWGSQCSYSGTPRQEPWQGNISLRAQRPLQVQAKCGPTLPNPCSSKCSWSCVAPQKPFRLADRQQTDVGRCMA
jgi:hypothetical protein